MDSVDAWIGLGLTRVNRIVTGECTVEETRYCFESAVGRIADPGVARACGEQLGERAGEFFPQSRGVDVSVERSNSEALLINGDKARRILESAFAQKKPVEHRLRAFFRGAAASFEQQGAQKGCAIGAVLLDLRAEDEGLRQICEEILASWIAAIAPHLPGQSPRKQRSFAAAVICAIEGAFILGRAQRSGQPFIDVAEWLVAAARGR